MKVHHIIIGLDVGGAELMLKRLIKSFHDKEKYLHTVSSLTNIGKVGLQLQALGVEVQALGMRSPLSIPRVVWRLVRRISSDRPDIVQTWMYHADLFGGLASRLAGNRKLIWGVRGSAIPQRGVSPTQLVIILCAWLSRYLPSVIVCCGESVRAAHAEMGYERSKMVVIPNGYELADFDRNPVVRREARVAFRFGDDDVVVGIVGRFDPLKDYRNFVLAATMLASKVEHVKFLMVGRGLDSANSVLMGWLAESGFAHKFVLAGERSDIPVCLSAMDVFCLSSSKEGFPNVVCEAMATKVPCVVTDAGDSAEIVADTGIVVTPCNATALADALQAMIRIGVAERSRLGEMARRRIKEHYSIEIASARFKALYHSCQQSN